MALFSFPNPMSESELELQRAFGRLEAKVDSLLHEVRNANNHHSKEVAALNHRVSVLEKWRTRLVAYSAGVSATVLVLFAFVWKLLSLMQ